jgi:hypothetical protein
VALAVIILQIVVGVLEVIRQQEQQEHRVVAAAALVDHLGLIPVARAGLVLRQFHRVVVVEEVPQTIAVTRAAVAQAEATVGVEVKVLLMVVVKVQVVQALKDVYT